MSRESCPEMTIPRIWGTKIECRDWGDGTEAGVLALHTPDPGLIPGTPYDFLSHPGVWARAQTQEQALSTVR